MAAKEKRLSLPVILSALISSNVLEAAFTSTPGTVSGCLGGSATFTWVYDNQADAATVVWEFGSVNVFSYQPSSGNTLPGAPQFAGRVTHNGGGSITLSTLTTNDVGSFSCTVNYNSNPTATDSVNLAVNQPFNGSVSTILTVSGSTATVNLGSLDGVIVKWKDETGTELDTGTTYTGEGKIRVCLTGCVSGSATTCQQIDLESRLSDGEIAGIVIGVFVGVVIIGVVIVVILWNMKLLCFKGNKLGDLVWAKLERYPWWPGLVCNHPTELTHQKSRKNPQIHVQFFDDPPSRAWIKAKNVKEFKGSDHADFKKGGLFFSLSEDIQKGAKEADEALKLTKERRLKLLVALQPYDDKNMEFHGYKLGDLVWAKLEGYPWWPSLICNRPTELTHQKSRENPQIHVQFFDDSQSRAWIKAKNVREFKGSDHADFKKGGLFFSLDEDVQKGAKQADEALKLTKKGRLELVADMEFDDGTEKTIKTTNAPTVDSGNVTYSEVATTDPKLDIENKKRHNELDPLTVRSDGQTEINKKKPMPDIGQKSE